MPTERFVHVVVRQGQVLTVRRKELVQRLDVLVYKSTCARGRRVYVAFPGVRSFSY